MQNQLITSVLVIILIVLAGIFLLNQFPQSTVPIDDLIVNDDDFRSGTELEPFIPEEIVTIFSYEDGLHEYSGVVEFPNSCWTLTAEALVRESFPEQVTLLFDSEAEGKDVLCAQVITPRTFRIIFSASEQATVDATFNGENINLLIIQEQALDLVEEVEVDSLE